MISAAITEQKQSCTQTPDSAPRTRRVYSTQEKADYLALFEQGGMTPADFCREMSLHEATFSLWRRSAREPSGASAFADVQLATTKTDSAPLVMVELPNGARIEVNAPNESAWSGLVQLIKALS
jgi:transposase-like protein